MDRNIKYIIGLFFIVIWLVAIVVGYQKGKKKASLDYSYVEDILPRDKPGTASGEKTLMDPKPFPFTLDAETFEPKLYSVKVNTIKEDLSIINEKGDELGPDQSDKLGLDLFAFNIFDNDIKTEDELKRQIKFNLEEKQDEEHYKGMEERMESSSNSRTENKRPVIKKAESQIFTNLK
ncbi:MAG: hypothetical protein PHF84_04805 [bacterium]|nr:hypothetical protein [bacterium]